MGINAEYSWANDLNGIDLLVEEKYPVYSYVRSVSGSFFREIKSTVRHNALNNKISIKIEKTTNIMDSGVAIISDEAILELKKILSECGINSNVTLYC